MLFFPSFHFTPDARAEDALSRAMRSLISRSAGVRTADSHRFQRLAISIYLIQQQPMLGFEYSAAALDRGVHVSTVVGRREYP